MVAYKNCNYSADFQRIYNTGLADGLLYKDSVANHLLHESKIIRRNYNFSK